MTNFADVASEIQVARSRVESRTGQFKMVQSSLDHAEKEVSRLLERVENLNKISLLLSSYADDRQSHVQGQIEGIVSKGLQSIFDQDLSFRIVNRMVGKRPETDFVLVSKVGGETLETSILDSRGGGVAAVAGFLMQAVLVLLTPNLRPTLFLDESFAQVSADYLSPLGEFIKELTTKSPLQVVMVTHQPEFSGMADRVYEFSQSGGITHVKGVTT